MLATSADAPSNTVATRQDTTDKKKVIIENADSQKLDGSTDTTFQYLQGNVRLLYDSVYFFADTAIVTDYMFNASGNVVIIKGDSLKLFADSLRYYRDQKRALFLAPVVVTKDAKRIYSEEGFYDMDDNLGEFIGDAQFVENQDTSTADKIIYNGKEEITSLLGQAKYRAGNDYGEADSIFYNQKTDKIKLEGNAIFQNEENEVTGNIINYDKKDDVIDVEGRSFLSNPPFLITANDLNYLKVAGTATADGEVIWKDTSSDYTIYADHIRYKEEKSYMTAYNDTGKPILENMMNATDTLRLSGDTLIAYKEVYAESDTQKVFLSYANVEILMEDMQAICDSLSFIERDSQFVLYEQPIMWSDSSQFSGDTVLIKLKEETIDEVNLLKNAVIISTEDMQFFNQIAGDNADAYFKEKKIKTLDVIGTAKSVYYLKDEAKAYIGANVTDCRRIIFKFEDGDLKQTRFYEENTHKLTPMDQVSHESIRVKGYNWNPDKRPLTLEDLKR